MFNVIQGTPENDSLTGTEERDDILGDDGNDRLFGGDGNDRLKSGAGDDFAMGDFGDDLVEGGAGNDTVRGGAGNDDIFGSSGDDVLVGGRGDDLLGGGEGNDRLVAGAGADTLVGGSRVPEKSNSGADIFDLTNIADVIANKGIDNGSFATIQDFTPSEGDVIKLNGSADYEFGTPSAGSSNNNVGLFLNSGSDSVLIANIEGFSADELTIDNNSIVGSDL